MDGRLAPAARDHLLGAVLGTLDGGLLEMIGDHDVGLGVGENGPGRLGEPATDRPRFLR